MRCDEPGSQTDWTRPGPFPVGRLDVARWCSVDGRDVAATVHHPEPGPRAPRPTFVFCHGLGSGRDDYAAIGAHVASHGIVSVHPEFEDAFVQVRARLGLQQVGPTTWPADPDARSAMHQLLFDPLQWRARARRVRATIDALDARGFPGPGTGNGVVVAGHSFGAFTAQMLAGVRVSDPALGAEVFSHPAVTGTVLLSPQGSGSRGLDPRSWDDLDLPLLVVTATHDHGPNGEGLAWRREPFDAAPVRDKWLVVAREHDHSLGGVAVADAGGPNEVVAGIAGTIAAFVTLVAGDTSAGAWLDSGLRSDMFDHQSLRSAS